MHCRPQALRPGGDSVFESVYSLIGVAVTALVVGFAFVKGDEPERVAGAAFVLVVLVGLVLPSILVGDGPRWSWMALDLVLLSVFLGIIWQSRRAWAVWASGFQALIVTGHTLVFLKLRPPVDAFAAVNNLANYGVLAALAIGTFWAWQERRASGLK